MNRKYWPKKQICSGANTLNILRSPRVATFTNTRIEAASASPLISNFHTTLTVVYHIQNQPLQNFPLVQYPKVYSNFYLNINQLDALNFIMSLFHASTCFKHMCSSSGGQNCTVQPLVSSH
jgi:hypothetical protein